MTLNLAVTLNLAQLTFHHHPTIFLKHKMIGFVSLLRTMYVDEPVKLAGCVVWRWPDN
jgi:hypothetical protein